MSYTPTIWQNNDIITAEKLNKLENAIGINAEVYTCLMNKNSTEITYLELYNLMQEDDTPIFVKKNNDYVLITSVSQNGDAYYINVNGNYQIGGSGSATDTITIYQNPRPIK